MATILFSPQCVNTLRPRQNGCHFPDDIFKWIFLNENEWIPIKISMKFVPQGPINKIPALVQIMACRRSGDKPLSEPMMVSSLTHICVTRPQWVNLIPCGFFSQPSVLPRWGKQRPLWANNGTNNHSYEVIKTAEIQVPTCRKPDQLDPWIRDQMKITLRSTISLLQLPNFVSCGRDKPSHMTQNLVTVGTKFWTAEHFLVDSWSMDQADLVW